MRPSSARIVDQKKKKRRSPSTSPPIFSQAAASSRPFLARVWRNQPSPSSSSSLVRHSSLSAWSLSEELPPPPRRTFSSRSADSRPSSTSHPPSGHRCRQPRSSSSSLQLPVLCPYSTTEGRRRRKKGLHWLLHRCWCGPSSAWSKSKRRLVVLPLLLRVRASWLCGRDPLRGPYWPPPPPSSKFLRRPPLFSWAFWWWSRRVRRRLLLRVHPQ